MSAEGGAAELVDVVRRAREGSASPHDVFEAFLRARVYCERPVQPGFLTVPAPEATPRGGDSGPRSRLRDLFEEPPVRLVPVFSSLEQFALFVDEEESRGGNESRGGAAWFSTTGADVLDLLPAGLDVWLDPGADHAVRLASAATRVGPVLHIGYRNQGDDS